MPLKKPHNHRLIWTDLLKDLDISSSSSWWQVVTYLYNKEHGYSNYNRCQARNHDQVREDVYMDKRIQQYLADDDSEGRNRQKIERILNEMCHQLTSQSNPSRRLKIAGVFFLKCITKVYSKVYVNNHLFPLEGALDTEPGLFKKQYLKITGEFPVVILPTHRSYMDFLFISYIMTHYEMALPIVATGDNFKAMGRFITDYLKSTGAFLLRRTASSRTDVEANFYYDILRAYVHSILKGGENPMEFFMEGTRTRVGQVLRPKTGLLSMVVDMLIDNIVDDIYILPVAINYQRPIEEQLYIGENTPQIDMRKPKESAKNLISAFDAIMKRQYGKVYVRFFEPFRLSEYFEEWKKAKGIVSIENGERDGILYDFTHSLASKVCLEQANNNILMPFNLITCSLLARSFIGLYDTNKPPHYNAANGYRNYALENKVLRVPFYEIVRDFRLLEKLLQSTQKKFTPGWQSHLEIIEEFKLDRDGIVRPTADRRYVEFNNDALTFQTMLYYSNQLTQILLPIAICFLLPLVGGETRDNHWEQYKEVRTLLSKEFFANETFMKQEFDVALGAIVRENKNISSDTRKMITKHLMYFINCYMKFFSYLLNHNILDRNEFFSDDYQLVDGKSPFPTLFISKDMLNNMINLTKEHGIVEVTFRDPPKINGHVNRRVKPEEVVTVKNIKELKDLNERFERARSKAMSVLIS